MDDNIDLNRIKTEVETLTKVHQIEVLRIMKEGNVILNENKNGVFINLTNVDADILNKVSAYLKYVSQQEVYLNELEDEKNVYMEMLDS
tara:strand:+ start:236 stop:502 length:267 start_codon:yes stop_codon:yes gene_type:complete